MHGFHGHCTDDLMATAVRRRNRQHGFTLIELLVVIALLTILAFIVVLNVSAFVDTGKAAACKTDLRSVQAAIDVYYNANGAYPWSGSSGTFPGLVPTYIHSPPTSTGAVTLDAEGNAAAAKC